MGPGCHSFYTALWFSAVVLLVVLYTVRAVDHREELIMIRSPEPIAVPIGDEVTLTCEMNVKADSFRWRHFPIHHPFSSTPIKIDRDISYEVPSSMYTYFSSGKGTTITINVNSTDIAGDYQCLVSYGASVLASVPGRITIAEIGRFPPSKSLRYSISVGNSVTIKCDLPPSNPQASVEYFRNNVALDQSLVLPTMSLLLQNISKADSGTYTCSASNYITGDTIRAEQKVVLTVTNNKNIEEPRFLTVPPNNYTAVAGANVFMECTAVGNPPPSVTWTKLGGQLNSNKTQMLPGGLLISNVTSRDQGTYICTHGRLEHHISLLFYEKPSVIFTYSSRITEGENLDLECTVKGTPEPDISWLLNGRSVLNETNIEVIGNKIYFSPIEKKDAGILQCMASNIVGASYEFIFLKIIPKQIPTPTDPMNHKNSESSEKTTKKPKKIRPNKTPVMIPPSKPIVTRLSDEAVMVRWTVPENEGLPIQFFKVQYRELGPASQMPGGSNGGRNKGWKTTNADIIPHLRSYQVDNLKSDHIYKFRIAAVYSNNDNKLGPNSAKFHLKREDFAKDPLPAPRLTRTEALSADSIKIYWDYTPSLNITIDGFYVNYQLASSAGDYFKVTVLGEQARSYTIRYLQPDTAYDIKLQSYTSSGPSDFSAVLQQKTLRLPDEVTTPPPLKNLPTSSGPSQLYIVIGASVAVVAISVVAIATVVLLKKKKNKKANNDQDNGDKGGGNEDRRHHINANGYTTKAIPRGLTNGCVPNRITITANPLADADDNQNQNMIEMSCLSSQNNNCSTVEASASNENTQSIPTKIKNTDNIKTRGKLKNEVVTAGENYV